MSLPFTPLSFSSSLSGPVPQITGQIFDVSLLESDTDEEKPSVSDDGTWISISDRFFQEISTSNNTVSEIDSLSSLFKMFFFVQQRYKINLIFSASNLLP